MLTMKNLKRNSDAQVKYYSEENAYYFSQGITDTATEVLSHVTVHGKMCAELGFTEGQAITKEQFGYILEGQDANGEKMTRKKKVKGIDCTMSAPKSLSIEVLINKNEFALECFQKASDDIMGEIEKQCSYIRLWDSNTNTSIPTSTGKIIYSAVTDGFSRNSYDPHLHRHLLIGSVTSTTSDGITKTQCLWTRKILESHVNKLYGSLFRMRLAHYLSKGGISLTYTKDGFYRLDKVSQELEEAFNTRAKEIEAEMKKGKSHLSAWGSTRTPKDPTVVKEEIQNKWKEVSDRIGFGDPTENRRKEIQRRMEYVSEKDTYEIEVAQERQYNRGNLSERMMWQLALERITQKSALARKEKIMTEYLSELTRAERWENIDFEELQRRFREQVELGNIFQIGNKYTSYEMIKADRDYIRCIKDRVNWSQSQLFCKS